MSFLNRALGFVWHFPRFKPLRAKWTAEPAFSASTDGKTTTVVDNLKKQGVTVCPKCDELVSPTHQCGNA
jgi:hypothetical protein